MRIIPLRLLSIGKIPFANFFKNKMYFFHRKKTLKKTLYRKLSIESFCGPFCEKGSFYELFRETFKCFPLRWGASSNVNWYFMDLNLKKIVSRDRFCKNRFFRTLWEDLHLMTPFWRNWAFKDLFYRKLCFLRSFERMYF